MDKNLIRSYVVLALAFIAFTVVALALPLTTNGVFWGAYVFAVVAMAVTGGALFLWFKRGETMSKFFGFPIIRIALIYLGVQVVLSLVFMLLAEYIPTWVVVIEGIVACAAACAGLIGADAAREEVERQEVVMQKDVHTMRTLQAKAKALPGLCNDPAAKKALTDLSDALRFSDPVSSDALMDIEAELVVAVNAIQQAVMDEKNEEIPSLCKKAQMTLAQRNSLCKAGK